MAFDFKSEEDVKLYLENIGTEYRFSCFKEKNAEGCHLLGEYMELIKRDFESAVKLFKLNCDERQYPRSCLKHATANYLGKGVEENFLTAFNYYKKACDVDSPEGCLYAGVMLTSNDKRNNQVLEKNFVEGLKYLEKSCLAGRAEACQFASTLHRKGAEGIPKDNMKAFEFSSLGCNGGNIYSCMNISQMYRVGNGIEKDEKKAEEFKQRARDIRDDQRKKNTIGLQQYT